MSFSFNRLRKRLFVELVLLFKEKTFEGRLKYIYVPKKQDSLLIVFPGFSKDKPRKYNYLLSLLKSRHCDLLFINDSFGYMGSYNLFEHGSSYPEEVTCKLIDSILKHREYRHLYFAGSSKGGTCALYFGIKFHAEEIYAGACQFYIGNYVANDIDPKVFKEMTGVENEEKWIEKLNSIMPLCIEEIDRQVPPQIVLLCSKNDPTFHNHVVPLFQLLDAKKIPYDFVESNYERHSEVGNDFSELLKKRFNT